MEFKTYLHQVFRGNVKKAELIQDEAIRRKVVLGEFKRLHELYIRENPNADKINPETSKTYFTEWVENTNFKIPRGKKMPLKVSIYNYFIKYLSASRGQQSSFNAVFYQYENKIKEVSLYNKNEDGEEISWVDDAEVMEKNNLTAVPTVEENYFGREPILPKGATVEMLEILKDKEIFQELSPIEREVIDLIYYKEIKRVDIANYIWICDKSYVSKVEKRALAKLRDLLTGI
jgi:hypothetical protein